MFIFEYMGDKRTTNSEDSMQNNFLREVKALYTLRHPAILSILGWSRSDAAGSCSYIITPYAELGTVRDFYKGGRAGRPDLGYSISTVTTICLQVAKALTYMHSWTPQPVLHRDVKSVNVFVRKTLDAQLADCGIARCGSKDVDMTNIGSVLWGKFIEFNLVLLLFSTSIISMSIA